MRVTKAFYFNPDLIANHITECFGLDCGYTKQICDIDIPDNFTVAYVTGESGSGKSTILNEVFPNYKNEDIPYDKPLYQWCGETENDEHKAIRLLSLCGLSDATMFISFYDTLSDSEKARARMFLELASNKEIIVIDEFLSTLDRKTAKALAYCFQKAIRIEGKRLFAVTAHDDLEDYLQPDVIIKGKSYPSKFSVVQKQVTPKNPFIENIAFKYVDKSDYKDLDLAELHYKGKYTGGTKEYLFAYLGDEVIACLVSIYNMSTGGRRISRVVVHPSYRGVGIGCAIVHKYISDYPDTDVVAAMALYNPIFEKAGMTRVMDSVIKSPSGLKKDIESLGFDTSKWFSRSYCLNFCSDLKVREVIAKYAKHCTKLVQPAGAHLTPEQIAELILTDARTCGRVLYQLRDRSMAKFINLTNVE